MSEIFDRTFRLEKLYHRLLKPRGIAIERVEVLAIRLFEAGFINLIQDDTGNIERFTELPKMAERQHRDEFFKIVNLSKEDIC